MLVGLMVILGTGGGGGEVLPHLVRTRSLGGGCQDGRGIAVDGQCHDSTYGPDDTQQHKTTTCEPGFPPVDGENSEDEGHDRALGQAQDDNGKDLGHEKTLCKHHTLVDACQKVPKLSTLPGEVTGDKKRKSV